MAQKSHESKEGELKGGDAMRKEEKPTDSGCLEKTMKFPRFRELCFIFYLPFHSFASCCRCVRFDFAIITTKKNTTQTFSGTRRRSDSTRWHIARWAKMRRRWWWIFRVFAENEKDITFARETLSKGIYRARIFTVFGAKRCATWLWEIVDLFFLCFALRSLLLFLFSSFFAISRVYIWKAKFTMKLLFGLVYDERFQFIHAAADRDRIAESLLCCFHIFIVKLWPDDRRRVIEQGECEDPRRRRAINLHFFSSPHHN